MSRLRLSSRWPDLRFCLAFRRVDTARTDCGEAVVHWTCVGVTRWEGAMAGEIIGRRAELLALEAFLGAVPAGGQALLLEGDAGIGKSALWYEGLRLARGRSFRLLTARAARSETQMTFATVGDLFAPVLETTLPRLVPVQRRALEIALLLRESAGRPPDARLLGLALVSVVRALAEDGPLLVAVDDVQWVDASSAEVLRFMVRRLEGEPVGVLGTVRERPVEAPLELDRAFGSFGLSALGPSTGCSGVASRSTFRGRFFCESTRSRAGIRSSRWSSAVDSLTGGFARTPLMSPCPRASSLWLRTGCAHCQGVHARRLLPPPRSPLPRLCCSRRWDLV
jgi:hypothetical protein